MYLQRQVTINFMKVRENGWVKTAEETELEIASVSSQNIVWTYTQQQRVANSEKPTLSN